MKIENYTFLNNLHKTAIGRWACDVMCANLSKKHAARYVNR